MTGEVQFAHRLPTATTPILHSSGALSLAVAVFGGPTIGRGSEMNKRMIMGVAAGVVAGATLMGVPTLALADRPTDPGPAGSDMAAVMEDPDFADRMAAVMSEMMSDEKLQDQMRSMMSEMGGMSGADHMSGGDMQDAGGMGGSSEEESHETP